MRERGDENAPTDEHVRLDNEVLTIKGKKKQESESKEKQYYRLERSYGAFARTVRLHQGHADPRQGAYGSDIRIRGADARGGRTMKWLSWAIAATLVGAPGLVGAQDGKMGVAGPPGAGASMACPMMGQTAMGMPHMSMGMPPHMSMGMPHMMAPGPDADPKTRARWMQMRGEMMKAMGEIMMRYGREPDAGK